MRKYIAAAFALAGFAVPMTASAHDVADGKDCRDRTAVEPSVTPLGTASEPDRGQVCVKAGGVVLLYIGGEVMPERAENKGTGGACGAVIVAGETRSGTDDWHQHDPNGDGDPSDDKNCD